MTCNDLDISYNFALNRNTPINPADLIPGGVLPIGKPNKHDGRETPTNGLWPFIR